MSEVHTSLVQALKDLYFVIDTATRTRPEQFDTSAALEEWENHSLKAIDALAKVEQFLSGPARSELADDDTFSRSFNARGDAGPTHSQLGGIFSSVHEAAFHFLSNTFDRIWPAEQPAIAPPLPIADALNYWEWIDARIDWPFGTVDRFDLDAWLSWLVEEEHEGAPSADRADKPRADDAIVNDLQREILAAISDAGDNRITAPELARICRVEPDHIYKAIQRLPEGVAATIEMPGKGNAGYRMAPQPAAARKLA
jgi:hypothetical protein